MAPFDAHADFAYTTVVTAPSTVSGTSLVVANASVFPATPFNAVTCPINTLPVAGVAEIVRVTNISSETLTMVRAQEGTTVVTIAAGWQIANAATSKVLTDIETAIPSSASQIGGVLAANNLSDVASAGTARYNLHTPDLTACAAVATTSVSGLSGLPTVDGYTLVAGDHVLLTAQSTGSQNGPWIAASGAWARPATYPSGGIIGGATGGTRSVDIIQGTLGGGGRWLLKTNMAITVDTTSTTWALQLPSSVETSTASGWLSLRNDFALNPSMSASSLTTAIQNAITSAISANKGIDFGADQWPIDAPLVIGGNLPLRAVGAAEVWSTVGNSAQTVLPGASPWVEGGGLIQEASGADILQYTAAGTTAHLRDLLLVFGGSSAFNNTGHAVNGNPPAITGGQDNGLTTCRWDNVVVFGHDGNHYAFYTVNLNYCTATALRSYGGGGWYQGVNANAQHYGNSVISAPYFVTLANGSADCYHLVANTGSAVNLTTFGRPQAQVFSAVGHPLGTAFGIASGPTLANQYAFRDLGPSSDNLLVAPDLEPPGATTLLSAGTTVIGPEYSSRSITNTAVGAGALPGTPTSSNNTAVGNDALGVANGGATSSTAIGVNALKLSTGSNNAAVGYGALAANVGGTNNNALGTLALAANTTGTFNTAVGDSALAANTTGSFSTAVGASALGNTTGANNTAVGYHALLANTGNGGNTAVGTAALAGGTGSSNTAVGYDALTASGTGSNNAAFGENALTANTSGSFNTAVGQAALAANTTNSSSTAVGNSALLVSTGANNTALGTNALYANTTGQSNSAVGYNAGRAIVTGSSCVAIGQNAGNSDGTTATTDNSSMTLIGEQAQGTTANVIVLGKAIATRPNLIFGGVGASAAFGGGVGVFAIANVGTAPASTPTGGGVLYVVAGALTWKGSSGTVTTIANA